MAVAVAPDGKVYAAGFVSIAGDQAMAVARVDATGKLDTTFGTNGYAVANASVGGKLVEVARGDRDPVRRQDRHRRCDRA